MTRTGARLGPSQPGRRLTFAAVTVPSTDGPHPAVGRHELAHEAATMALYVAIVVEAELLTLWVGQGPGNPVPVEGIELVALIWGTTIGLAVAHLFAFRLASRAFVREGRTTHGEVAAAQLAGAAVVAALCSVPGIFASDANDLRFSLYVPELIIGVAGYATARTSGSSRFWSLAIGLGAAAVGLVIAVFKNVLGGH